MWKSLKDIVGKELFLSTQAPEEGLLIERTLVWGLKTSLMCSPCSLDREASIAVKVIWPGPPPNMWLTEARSCQRFFFSPNWASATSSGCSSLTFSLKEAAKGTMALFMAPGFREQSSPWQGDGRARARVHRGNVENRKQKAWLGGMMSYRPQRPGTVTHFPQLSPASSLSSSNSQHGATKCSNTRACRDTPHSNKNNKILRVIIIHE